VIANRRSAEKPTDNNTGASGLRILIHEKKFTYLHRSAGSENVGFFRGGQPRFGPRVLRAAACRLVPLAPRERDDPVGGARDRGVAGVERRPRDETCPTQAGGFDVCERVAPDLPGKPPVQLVQVVSADGATREFPVAPVAREIQRQPHRRFRRVGQEEADRQVVAPGRSPADEGDVVPVQPEIALDDLAAAPEQPHPHAVRWSRSRWAPQKPIMPRLQRGSLMISLTIKMFNTFGRPPTTQKPPHRGCHARHRGKPDVTRGDSACD